MKMIGNGTYYVIPVRRFSSISPNIKFIDCAKQHTRFTRNRRRRREMINEMIAFHYVVNVYHVNSVGGIDDINRYSELPHVLIGDGITSRIHPYWGHSDDCSIMWDNLVWGRLYEKGNRTEENHTPWLESHPTNRTYIDIIAEGVDYSEECRRVRAIFKIIDGKMCELWWLNDNIKEKISFKVIESYKTFCEMTDPYIYTEQFIEERFNQLGYVNYDEWPFIHQFTHANLFHSNIVDVMSNIIREDHQLKYALNLVSFRVHSPYINQSVIDKADLINKMRFALTVTYMLHVCGKFLEGNLYFRGNIDKYRDNPFILG